MAIEDAVEQVPTTRARDVSSQAVFGPQFELEHHKIVPVSVVARSAGGGVARPGGGDGVNVRPLGFIHESGDRVVFTPIHAAPQDALGRAEVAAFGRRVALLVASFVIHFLQRRAGQLPPRASAPIDITEVSPSPS